MDEPSKTGHVYPAGAVVFHGSEDEAVYRARNAMLVKALRSGNFTQTRGTLEAVTSNGYRNEVVGNCCLGVACRVAEREAGTFAIVTRISGGKTNFGTIRGGEEFAVPSLAAGYPPELVRDWFGWESNNPILYGMRHDADEEVSGTAAGWNDNAGASFETIADAFERTYVTFTRRSVDDLHDGSDRLGTGPIETTVSDLPE